MLRRGVTREKSGSPDWKGRDYLLWSYGEKDTFFGRVFLEVKVAIFGNRVQV